MDPSIRSHRRAVWLTVALLLVYAVGFVGYELNWIHQRRAARTHELCLLSVSWSNIYSLSPRHLPARGAGPLDRLAMRLFNEDEWGTSAVIYLGHDPDVFAKLKDEHCPDDVLEDLAEVQHGHWLFPEAKIYIEYWDLSEAADD